MKINMITDVSGFTVQTYIKSVTEFVLIVVIV